MTERLSDTFGDRAGQKAHATYLQIAMEATRLCLAGGIPPDEHCTNPAVGLLVSWLHKPQQDGPPLYHKLAEAMLPPNGVPKELEVISIPPVTSPEAGGLPVVFGALAALAGSGVIIRASLDGTQFNVWPGNNPLAVEYNFNNTRTAASHCLPLVKNGQQPVV